MSSNKINILLDLDQTLISAESTSDYDFKKNKSKSKKFTFYDMDGYYIVFERPNLQTFLDDLFANFNVSVWTAASKDYALFIIDKIILQNNNKRKLDWVFFSYHCDISQKIKKGSKVLEMLWDVYKIPGYNKNNTFILDDYDEVYNTQPDNCIIAKPFEFEDTNSNKDNFLSKLSVKLKDLKENKSTKSINTSLGTV
jgi:hypothetical protein